MLYIFIHTYLTCFFVNFDGFLGGKMLHTNEISNVFSHAKQGQTKKASLHAICCYESSIITCAMLTKILEIFFHKVMLHDQDDALESLSTLDMEKSTGPDEPHSKILRHIAQYIAAPLTVIFNISLDQGVTYEQKECNRHSYTQNKTNSIELQTCQPH